MFIDEAERFLGLDEMDSYCADDVKRAYRNLAKSLHPDVLSARHANPDSINALMSQLNEAYALLKDVEGYVTPVAAFQSVPTFTEIPHSKTPSWIASLGSKVKAARFLRPRDLAFSYGVDVAC